MDGMIINVTDTYNRARYVDIISFNLLLLADNLSIFDSYKRGNMAGKLRGLLEYIRDHASAYLYGKHYTGVSVRKLAELYGGSLATWEKYLHLWVEWGLLGRIDHSVSENNIFEINAREYARVTEVPNATSMYTVNRWTADQLASLQPVRGSGTKASTIHRRGQAEADRIYGDRRRISLAQQRAEKKILARIRAEIANKGYCTRGELRGLRVRYTDREGIQRRIKIDNVFDDMREVLTAEGLRYGAPTAEERERFNLNSREWIITASERNKAEGGKQ